jgi:hypothetical protein
LVKGVIRVAAYAVFSAVFETHWVRGLEACVFIKEKTVQALYALELFINNLAIFNWRRDTILT